MKRLWVTFNTGSALLSLAAAAETRVLLRTLAEADLASSLHDYTVTRSLFSLYLGGTAGDTVVAAGLIILNENIALGAVTPSTETHADWFWFEQFAVGQDTVAQGQSNVIERDISGRRRADGLEKGLFLHMNNRGAVALTFFLQGRKLLLPH